ncbi:hypothetical protein NMY22_g16287 [Coprinellus aureogranulatus]|nr:hypothetical protein NMY22_g16287 [Coprinellus aureogranulatus]
MADKCRGPYSAPATSTQDTLASSAAAPAPASGSSSLVVPLPSVVIPGFQSLGEYHLVPHPSQAVFCTEADGPPFYTVTRGKRVGCFGGWYVYALLSLDVLPDIQIRDMVSPYVVKAQGVAFGKKTSLVAAYEAYTKAYERGSVKASYSNSYAYVSSLSLRLPADSYCLPTPDTLDHLAFSLSKTGSPDNLQESVCLYREALRLRPPGHPARGESLTRLASSLSMTGLRDNLQELILLYREVLELRPLGHPDRGEALDHLGCLLSETGLPNDLQESTSLHREALELRPPGHPNHEESLDNLSDRLSKTGSIEDQAESIRLHREARDLCPPPGSPT